MAVQWWRKAWLDAQRGIGRKPEVSYGVCVRCLGYQTLHRNGLCWDCAPRRKWGGGYIYEEPSESVIYYAEQGGLIKIGSSDQVYRRIGQLEARLLATEPGSYELEAARHRQFSADRTRGPGNRGRDGAESPKRGDWFRPGPELREHIRNLPGKPRRRMAYTG